MDYDIQNDHSQPGHMLEKTFYQRGGYLREAENGPDWQPGGDWYQSVFDMLKETVDYTVRTPRGEKLDITPEALILIAEDGKEEQAVRDAITFDAQQSLLQDNLARADMDLGNAGLDLAARNLENPIFYTRSDTQQPFLMSDLVRDMGEHSKRINRIYTDRRGRLIIATGNEPTSGSSYEVKELAPKQSFHLQDLISRQSGWADRLWKSLKTPVLKDVYWVHESEQDYQLKQTTQKVSRILTKTGVFVNKDFADFRIVQADVTPDEEHNSVNVVFNNGALDYDISVGASAHEIASQTISQLKSFNPVQQGDTKLYGQMRQKQFQQIISKLSNSRKQTL